MYPAASYRSNPSAPDDDEAVLLVPANPVGPRRSGFHKAPGAGALGAHVRGGYYASGIWTGDTDSEAEEEVLRSPRKYHGSKRSSKRGSSASDGAKSKKKSKCRCTCCGLLFLALFAFVACNWLDYIFFEGRTFGVVNKKGSISKALQDLDETGKQIYDSFQSEQDKESFLELLDAAEETQQDPNAQVGDEDVVDLDFSDPDVPAGEVQDEDSDADVHDFFQEMALSPREKNSSLKEKLVLRTLLGGGAGFAVCSYLESIPILGRLVRNCSLLAYPAFAAMGAAGGAASVLYTENEEVRKYVNQKIAAARKFDGKHGISASAKRMAESAQQQGDEFAESAAEKIQDMAAEYRVHGMRRDQERMHARLDEMQARDIRRSREGRAA